MRHYSLAKHRKVFGFSCTHCTHHFMRHWAHAIVPFLELLLRGHIMRKILSISCSIYSQPSNRSTRDTGTKKRDGFAGAHTHTYALHLFTLLLSVLSYPPPSPKKPTNVLWDTRSGKGNIIMPNCGTLGIAALRRD